MTTFEALRDGIRRVSRAPVVLACVFVLTLAFSLPFSFMLRGSLAGHLGNSLAAEEAARGVNALWWTEYLSQADGLGATFKTTIIGFAAVLDNLSALLDRSPRPAALLWAGGAYLLLWLFLAGGILDRYARNRPTRAYEFFTACGVYFTRFLRLAPVIAFVYYVLFAYVHPLLFDDLYRRLTRDVTVERTAWFYRVILYLSFGALLVSANIIFDYTKVRAVVEDRRSMIGALAAGLRFVRRNFLTVAGLYVLNGGLFVALIFIYAVVAPGAGASGAGFWLGFAVGQLYILARLWIRLLFFASEASLFKGRLAHAGYVAGSPVRPLEPAIVEQIAGVAESKIPNR